eukprot:5392221-Pyramimonas_sp.AAC.1
MAPKFSADELGSAPDKDNEFSETTFVSQATTQTEQPSCLWELGTLLAFALALQLALGAGALPPVRLAAALAFLELRLARAR